jgi:hypothetical protein
MGGNGGYSRRNSDGDFENTARQEERRLSEAPKWYAFSWTVKFSVNF